MDSFSDRQINRYAQGYIHEDEHIENLSKWGFRRQSEKEWRQNADPSDDGYTYADSLEHDRQFFIQRHNEAVDLYQHFLARFQACTPGNRDEIQAVRQELRLDARLLNTGPYLYRLVKGKTAWFDQIFRAEAANAERNGAELRAEQERKRQEERQKEAQAMQNNENFGMF